MKVLISALKAILFLPLFFVPAILNFILRDLNSIAYTRKDMRENPYAYSLLGWLFVYTGLSMIVALFLLTGLVSINLENISLTVIWGGWCWFLLLLYAIFNLGGIVKTLTVYILKFVKFALGLRSQKLTLDGGSIHTTT